MEERQSKGRSLTEEQRRALARLPAVDELLALAPAAHARARMSPAQVSEAARAVVDAERGRILDGAGEANPERVDWAARLEAEIARRGRRKLQAVINATGVVLHTNLGRAPLSEAAIRAVTEVAKGYSNLEYDIERGARGSRHDHAEELLKELTGAEAAMVVNNNAAAVLLVLSALAAGKEVIISRGEMIEIGGSFRIPDVIVQSGCRLVEVGTTNRTHLSDYARAVTPETAVLLKVHSSNYRVVGFTHSVTAKELAELARERGLLVIEDLGSGVLLRTERYGLAHEPTVLEEIKAGADVVTFSGDKLLGGPQVGVIAGRRELVAKCRKHPLARALRVDKMTLAALQATLLEYARGRPESVPIWRMIAASPEEVRLRAVKVVEAVRTELDRASGVDGDLKVSLSVEEGRSAVGGGSLPGETLPTCLVAVRFNGRQGSDDESRPLSVNRLARALRLQEPPIVARADNDALYLDLRTVDPGEDAVVAAALCRALKADRGRTP